jgi:hypothetical protein
MDGKQLAKARTVKPNGEACRRMRIERGWDELAMAAKTGLTKKTIESVEAGNPCFLFTLSAFKDAFGLPDTTPLLEPDQPIPPPVYGGPRVRVIIRLRLPFADCDFTQWLINLINKIIVLIDPTGNIEVVGVAIGSIIITLEMDANDTRKMVSAFGSGEFDDLRFDSIATNFGQGETLEFKAITRTQAFVRPPRPPAPTPQPKPQKSLFQRLSTWLFGEGGSRSDPPPYREQGASIFDRFKQGQT